ncbi:MAG: FAD-dependent oxidoreductase [Rhodovarius sp.]|nr:FAD-dependent oxidoreductase [Rhodovarius sp.]MCX7932381.1 FAD-dependent oxidoreductase [Rhodovarius sp.]MDW8314132.1 FAD-dependent oxidoreductase [Rhodovarius sp.]
MPPPPRRPVLRQGMLWADLCVIGAGAGGLSVAAGAAQMGAAVVLIERGRMGGECLHSGCIPSKALLAAAHAAAAQRAAGRFGIAPAEPVIDWPALRRHLQGVIAAIAPHDSAERFTGLGVTVLSGTARFIAPDRVEAAGLVIRARRFVIATGSSPALPALPGLETVPFLTNETLFDLPERPAHLLVLGGGPMGVEMAQAFRRLGAEVTLLARRRILPRDEPEAGALLRQVLMREGVRVMEGAEPQAVAPGDGGGVRLRLADGQHIAASHLLLATGRRPNIAGLGLDAAGIATTPRGIVVDGGMRTSNRRVFAVGDVTGGPAFTHVAAEQAGVVLRRALFGLPARLDLSALPWVTFTAPEVAHAGLTEAAARAAGWRVQVATAALAANDRAQAERCTEGMAKLVLGPGGRILGATLIAPHAGEMIGLFCLAIRERLPARRLAAWLAPYPTMAEIGKRAAATHLAPLLFGAGTRRLVGLIQRLLP